MESRNSSNSNAPLFSDEEIRKLVDSSNFTEEQLRKLFEASKFQYTKEELIRLVESAYIPLERRSIHLDQKHDVIYFVTKVDEVKELEKPLNQPSSSTNQIYKKLNNSPDTFGSENRIDGINTRRGEGLPYREDIIQHLPVSQPYISKILSSRHPENAENNTTNGCNAHRGEGLPYQEITVVDNNIDGISDEISSVAKNDVGNKWQWGDDLDPSPSLMQNLKNNKPQRGIVNLPLDDLDSVPTIGLKK